jgi:hypothetical protein
MIHLFGALRTHPALGYYVALAAVNYLMVAAALLALLTGGHSWLFLALALLSSLYATNLLWEHRPHS